jgi:MYXO-CTERM domain-containing protein
MRNGNVWLAVVVFGILGFSLAPRDALAHFVLDEPESWRDQNVLGDPQKLGPCGDDGTAAETGAVTAFQTGQTITITIRETIFHPGHYRVALAVNDRSELPEPPPVTAGSTPCGSAPIMDPPVFPVLADGLLVHTSSLSGPQTIEVTLPPDVTCDHCTLQVIQFMSNHGLNNPGGCFYHHCADISIHDTVVVDAGQSVDAGSSVDAGQSVDAGDNGSPDAGMMPVAAPQGCACSTPGHGSSSSVAALGLIALVTLMLNRRRAR